MGDAGDAPADAEGRLAELAERVERAAELIGELRERNHELSAELVTLKNELKSRPEPTSQSGSDVEVEPLRAELEALRGERDAIRSKVMKLLERVEKLEA